MKAIYSLLALLVIAGLFLGGCEEGETIFKTLEKSKLAPPLGLRSVTGNGQITLFWFTSNYEDDFGGYYIFRALGDYSGQSKDSTLSNAFVKVDSISLNPPQDREISRTITGLTNGQTYSFAVTAFKKDNRREISYPSNVVTDTPRPEITSVKLKSASTAQVTGDDSQAGFDFNTFTVVQVPAVGYTSDNGADIINEAFDPGSAGNIRCWLAGMNGGGLQDLGYMDDLKDADVAPSAGYSEQGKSIAVLLGHVYAVKTGDNHYGKLLITSIGGAPDYAITFNAAFQLQEGNRNYKPVLRDWKWLLGIH
ncbi:MAG: hypothetical protein ONB05_03300 [candidate division KSB1 bacterium]|nr:hypothetical protein [candidate division KSB1 bacterium]